MPGESGGPPGGWGSGTLGRQVLEQGFEFRAPGRLQVLDGSAGRADRVAEDVEGAKLRVSGIFQPTIAVSGSKTSAAVK